MECLTCGARDNLTVDHLTPKSIFQNGMTPRQKQQYHEQMEQLRKNNDAKGFAGYGIMCKRCNMMKHNMPLKDFVHQILKMAEWITDYDKNHPAKAHVEISYPTFSPGQKLSG